METPKERNEMKELRKRVRALEEALSDALLNLKLAKAYTKIACHMEAIALIEAACFFSEACAIVWLNAESDFPSFAIVPV